MFGGKSPPSLIITTGAEIGANYVGTPHMGGSVSPSSTTSSSSSSPCPSTPSSSTHTFSMQHNHFQPHQRIGESTPSLGGVSGKQQRVMQRKGRGGNWQQMNYGNNFMPRGPPFCPPFPPPHGMFFPPPPFMNGPPPPFFPPPAYSSSGMPMDTSMPPPPYSMAPPPFFMGFPPPPPSFFHSNHNGHKGGAGMQQQSQQQEGHDSRPSSREGGGSLASTELSYPEHSEDGSYETSSEDEEFVPSPEVNMGKRSYLFNFRPKSKRAEPGTTPPPIGDKEFDTFSSILTKGDKSVKDTEIMDRFIVEYMKLNM